MRPEGDLIRIHALKVETSGRPGAPLEYALAQLAGFCRGPASIEAGPSAGDGASVLLVGREAAERRLPGSALPDWEALGEEGYALRVAQTGTETVIVAAGAAEAGTRHAVYALMREMDISALPPTLPRNLDIRRTPSTPLRGMYAHQHWAYEYPYALRTWTVEEWKSYVDVLALLGYNLFQIWSMACIIPMPPCPEDEEFLRRYPPVIDHARDHHGMEVWIGECANNVCAAGEVPPVTRRLYFDVERLLDPGDPSAMRELRDCRDTFYRICDNADGYWVIDSDPGSWEGSPSSELVDILMMNRELLDARTAAGREAKLVYWMHFGWGAGEQRENWREALSDLKRRNPEPWLLTGGKAHFGVVDELGLAGRLVYYQYGAIEPEPSLPYTRVVPPELREALETGSRAFNGAMGNAQTPVCQLPNIYFFARSFWGEGRSEQDVAESVRALARLVYPEQAGLLARAWMALRETDRQKAADAARGLEALEMQCGLGRPGPVGMKLFPDSGQVARDLVLQLRLHEAELSFRELAKRGATDDRLMDALAGYCRLSLNWRRHTGFRRFAFNGYTFDPVLEAVRVWWDRADSVKTRALEFLEASLTGDFDAWEIDLAIAPLRTAAG